MSARRAQRPDLAIAEVRTTWTPAPGDRVRRPHHTTQTARTQGTARVIMLRNDGRIDVAVDPGPMERPGDSTWAIWNRDDTVLVRAADASPEAPATNAALPHTTTP